MHCQGVFVDHTIRQRTNVPQGVAFCLYLLSLLHYIAVTSSGANRCLSGCNRSLKSKTEAYLLFIDAPPPCCPLYRPIFCVDYLPSLLAFVVGEQNKSRPYSEWGHPHIIRCVRFTPDGGSIIIGAANNSPSLAQNVRGGEGGLFLVER